MRRGPVVLLMGLLASSTMTITVNAKKPDCPEGYQRVPLSQAASMLKDFAGCKVEVEGHFMLVMDQELAKGYKTNLPRKYKKHVLFLIGDGGSNATVAVEKDKSTAVFTLAAGDRLEVKGTVDASAAKSARSGYWTTMSGRSEELLIDMEEMKIVADNSPDSPFPPSVGRSQPHQQSIADKLKELQELKDKGLITDEEYEKKRKELLEKM